MAILIIAAAGLILMMLVTRGSWKKLVRIEFRSTWALVIGLIIQTGLEVVDIPKDQIDKSGFAALMVSYALILGFCIANLHLTGMGIVTLGIGLNAFIIALNQGMPVKQLPTRAVETTVKHHLVSDEDILPALGDDILFPQPVGGALSYGDLILVAGLVNVAYRGSRKRRDPKDVDQHHLAQVMATKALENTTTDVDADATLILDAVADADDALDTGKIGEIIEPSASPQPAIAWDPVQASEEVAAMLADAVKKVEAVGAQSPLLDLSEPTTTSEPSQDGVKNVDLREDTEARTPQDQ